MKVLVTHPGRQHSHQAALALEKAGLLAGYWAGVPASGFRRYAPVPLDPARTVWFPWTPALRPDRAPAADFAACRLFDRWAARRLGQVRGDRGHRLRDLGPLDLPRRRRGWGW